MENQDIKIVPDQAIGEPKFAVAPLASPLPPTPENVAPVALNPPIATPPPATSSDSSISASSGNLDYTLLGVQLLVVTGVLLGIYYLKYRAARDARQIAKLQSDYNALQTEKAALEISPAQKSTSAVNSFFQ